MNLSDFLYEEPVINCNYSFDFKSPIRVFKSHDLQAY